ncbi:hypothetical protein N7541_004730 [Penicillium brevicompactum]|uniref:Uncharacterized protein n=1 Tax=Penicillium brevicompactum TaxID=5074 RepID=A0A9W9RCL8_PENBR|nr:hypothetical protein N7541_004730 [Penicillium brevicompactum]
MYHIKACMYSANLKKLRKIASLGIFSKGKTSSPNDPLSMPSDSCPRPSPKDVFRKRQTSSDLAFSKWMSSSNPSSGNIPAPNPVATQPGGPLSNCHASNHTRSTLSEVDMTSNNPKSLMLQREASRPPATPSQWFKHRPSLCPPGTDIFKFLGARDPHEPIPAQASSDDIVQRDVVDCKNDSFKVDVLENIEPRDETCSLRPPKRLLSPPVEFPQKRERLSTQSSCTPYTWSESEDNAKQNDHALEKHLLDLLHAGLNSQGTFSEIPTNQLEERYWGLSELWLLLEERKELWPDEGDKKHQEQQQVPSPSSQRPTLKLAEKSRSSPFNMSNIREKVFRKRLSPKAAAQIVSNNSSSPLQQYLDLRSSQGPEYVGADVEKNALLAQVSQVSQAQKSSSVSPDKSKHQFLPLDQGFAEEPEDYGSCPIKDPPTSICDFDLHALSRVEDDDLFYQTLEAAFDTIMDPRLPAIVASHLQELLTPAGLRRPLEHPQPSQANPTPSRYSGAEKKGELCTATSVLPDCIDLEASDTIAFAPPIGCETSTSNDKEHDDPSDEMSWLVGSRSQLDPSTRGQTDRSPAAALSGFWRKNKLY